MEMVPVCVLGRESLSSVSVGVLQQLVSSYQHIHTSKVQVYVRCTNRLEIIRKLTGKLGEDEGFESDESTSSSCCLVDDHVFKEKRQPSPANGDSANSSAGSDTEEETDAAEKYDISDVIFCHTEPRYPNTIAWVIKKKANYFDTTSRLGKTGVESTYDNCLDVIVVRCHYSEDFKKLCNSYREQNRRVKLDQYQSINRRKLIDTNQGKVALSDIKLTPSSLLKASELSILNPKIVTSFKNEMKNSLSLNSLLKSELSESKPRSIEKSSSLTNIRFNLIQTTDVDGITHIEVSKPKSFMQKEIEGVILTEIDSNLKKDVIRQRQCPTVLSDPKPWAPEKSDTQPMRPERRKYLRKLTAPAPPTFASLTNLSEIKSKSKFYLPIQEEETTQKTEKSHYGKQRSWKDDKPIVRTLRNNAIVPEERRRDRKVPMAYRYIDTTPSNVTTIIRRRSNSFDNHKSIIKSSNKPNKFNEPKKVTFSAYATVQVVD